MAWKRTCRFVFEKMHANISSDRGGSWRLPPDETLQVQDPKQKDTELDLEDGHNWRSIIFSLLVISFVIAGIITAIYLLGYVNHNKVILFYRKFDYRFGFL